MRREKWFKLIIVALSMIFILNANVGSGAGGNLLVFEDDYLNLDYTDLANTSAAVFTQPPGIVTISQGQVPFAYRPGTIQVAAGLTDRIALLEYNGKELKELRSVLSPQVTSLAFSADGRFLVAVERDVVNIYGFTENGDFRTVGSVYYPGAIAVDGAGGSSFWVMSQRKASYYGFDGKHWREFFPIALSNGKKINYDRRRNAILLLDGERVRYLGFDGVGWAEIGLLSITVPGAVDVAWVRDGSGFRVLGRGGNVFYFAITPYGLRRYSDLEDNVFGGLAIGRSPWGGF